MAPKRQGRRIVISGSSYPDDPTTNWARKVVAGDIVAFHELAHAEWFMTLEMADYVTEEQVAQIVAERQGMGQRHATETTDQPAAADAGADAAASDAAPAQSKRGKRRG